ncbi:hypothetical protein SOVF_202220 [Spinacia oleracea]|nr:hypothetical protein SOVF_202220 [Spinacia oleracea]
MEQLWIAPPADYLKLNTDGAWKGLSEAGGGGVFRRSSGTWYLGYSSKFNVVSPLATELYAIREGLIMAVEHKVSMLQVETDALSLLTMMKTIDDHHHHELSPVLNDVASLLTRFEKVEITHIPRARNMVAHCLAANSLSMAVGHKVYVEVPQFARGAYLADLQGLVVTIESAPGVRDVRELIDLEAETMVAASTSLTSEIQFGTIPTAVSIPRDNQEGKGKGKEVEGVVRVAETSKNAK